MNSQQDEIWVYIGIYIGTLLACGAGTVVCLVLTALG